MDWKLSLILFFIGGAIGGSFLNVVIYRLPQRLSLFQPRSHCTHCKAKIPFYRNIPLVSFILQRGKCKKCNGQISPQYPLVELITGVVWSWCFLNLEGTEAVLTVLLFSTLITIAWIDGSTMNIPLNLILFALGVEIVGFLLGNISLREALGGAFVGVICLGLIMLLTFLLTKRQGMGFGDLQLGLVLGIWLGSVNMALTLFGASFISLLVWLGISARKGLNKNRALPFAPFLIFSAGLVFVIDFYLGVRIIQFFI